MRRRIRLVAACLVVAALVVCGCESAVTKPSPSLAATPVRVDVPIPSPDLRRNPLAAFDPLALAQAVPGGSPCRTLAPINPNSVYGTDRHSSWAIGCPHASGDRTIYFLLADAIKATLEHGGVTVLSSHGTTNDAPGPLENDWLLVGNGVVAFARIIAFDDGSMLSMAVTLDTGTQ